MSVFPVYNVQCDHCGEQFEAHKLDEQDAQGEAHCQEGWDVVFTEENDFDLCSDCLALWDSGDLTPRMLEGQGEDEDV